MLRKYGLLTKDKALPLQSTSITGSIKQIVAQINVTQVYINHEAQQVEAVYFFPLSIKAAICGFKVDVNDKVINSKVCL